LRREVWVDGKGQVTRYNLAYINHNLYQRDNGRVLGYESSISFEDPADLHKLLAIVDELELATSPRHHER